jgi:teichuronic acid biosynthesis glycosyltransferase TuaC
METLDIMLVCDHFPEESNKNVLGMAKALGKAGHDVTVVGSNVGKTGKILPANDGEFFRIVRLPSVKIPRVRYTYTPSAENKLYDIYRVRAPDVVHSHFIMYHLALSSAHLARRVPILLTLHGFTLPADLGFSPGRIPLEVMYSTLGLRLVRNAKRFICVSAVTKEKLLMQYPELELRSSVLPFGLDPEHEAQLSEASPESVKAKLGLDGRRTFIFVGRVANSKGVRELAKAYRNLRRKRDDIALLFLGDGPQLDPLREAYSSVEGMHFLGFRKDVGTFLQAADVLVLPSYREGLPTVILEAMLRGLGVAATRVGGIRDLCNAGSAIHVFDEPKVGLIEEGLSYLADVDEDKLCSWGKTNQKVFQENYTWDSILPDLVSLYRTAMDDYTKQSRL